MSPLQWALLIFGVVAVVAVYLYSRRDRRAMEGSNEPEEPLLPPAKSSVWLPAIMVPLRVPTKLLPSPPKLVLLLPALLWA